MERVAGAVVEESDEAVVIAQRGHSDLQDRFAARAVVPELLRPFHPGTDSFTNDSLNADVVGRPAWRYCG